jgi:endonuclease/exonuclease/phosphatase (EEP) superfamily protein YafD
MKKLILASAHLYLLSLFGWLAARAIFADGHWVLFLLNALGFYWFMPLLVVGGVAAIARSRWLGMGVALGGLAWVGLFGGLFLPRFPAARAGGPILRVMTYNMLGYTHHPEAVVAAIRAARADIVGIQELNSGAARALQTELITEYPYQYLLPEDSVMGMGIISRYPMTDTGTVFPGLAVGPEQVMAVAWNGQAMHVVHIHPAPGGNNVALREQTSRDVLAYAAARPGPTIVLGDLNATDLNRSYAMLLPTFRDAWREARAGLSGTFPGSDPALVPGSSRPRVGGFAVPQWLIRIDYVFHSAHFQTLTAAPGPWDGNSDHRPVVAELALP